MVRDPVVDDDDVSEDGYRIGGRLDVHRLHVQEGVGDGDGHDLSELDLGSLLVEKRQLIGDGGGVGDNRLHELRAVHGLTRRCLVERQLPVVAHVCGREHHRREVLPARLRGLGHKGLDDQELLLGLPRQSGHLIGRVELPGAEGDRPVGILDAHLIARPGTAAARILADVPGVGLGEESGGLGQVVAPVHVGLDLEKVLGVAEVGGDAGDLLVRERAAREQVGERLLVDVDDGVLRSDDEEVHLPGVGVDHDLDRVGDVVELARQARRGRHPGRRGILGVRVVGGRRIGVHDPPQLIVEHHAVGVGIVLEEGRRLLDPLGDVAVVDDARLRGDLARQEDVGVAEAQGERRPAEEVAGRDASLARVVGRDLLVVAALVVELLLLGVGDHEAVGGASLPVVHLGPDIAQGGCAQGRHIGEGEGGVPAGIHPGLVGRRHGGGVTVGVLQVLGGKPVGHRGVQLPDADQRLGEGAAEGVAVDLQVVDGIVRPQGLELVEGVDQPGRVEELHVGERVLIGDRLGRRPFDLVGRDSGGAVEIGDRLDVVEAVSGPGGGDVAVDVRRLAGQL